MKDVPFIGVLVAVVVWFLFREEARKSQPQPVNDLTPVSDLVESVSSSIAAAIREALRPYEVPASEPDMEMQFPEMVVDVPDPADFYIPDEIANPSVSWAPPPGHEPWITNG